MLTITKNKLISYQGLFYSRIGNSHSVITVQHPTTPVPNNQDDEFMGDSKVSWNSGYDLKAYYTKNINQQRKDKFGVADDVSIIVYVSPIELNTVTGSYTFSDDIMNNSRGIRFLFEGSYYTPTVIIEHEKFKVGVDYVALTIEIRLKKVD